MSDKVLITGGAGYIGSHTAWAFLDRGYRVVVLDDLSTGFESSVPASARFVRTRLDDIGSVREVLAAERPAGVIHFAGSTVVPESVAEPARYYTNNTANSLALFDACAEAGVGTVIFSSTAAVYGITGSAPVAETAPTAPISPYGWSKLFTERMLQDIAQARGMSAGILRYFNVAGADGQLRTGQLTRGATHLIKVAVECAVGARPAIEVFGDDYDTPDGTCVRDFIHVSDLAEAHVLAFERLHADGGQLLLNCGYGRGYSVRQVLDTVTALAGPIAARHASRRPGDAPSVVADTRALRNTLPWSPRYTDLRDIVATALAWERAQQSARPRLAESA
ncbi:UDP-glucose 4-epimerase GalE [Rhodovibrio salinarum]|uniref:UDP-glucose 4-epimerase GalE n=1 Tax=Rhodovibrio salinarum TaxID=1087 RepID=UPI00055D03FD|nr:UDP-glucose 4-epimerase GalE [Rhodovibrio salinarum]